MLRTHASRSLSTRSIQGQLVFFQICRAYSSRSTSGSDDADLEAARDWYRQFNHSTIPSKLAKTTFSRSSGPGGQKVNKTSSKATTAWPVSALLDYIPKALHTDIRNSRYYVASSNSLSIQCDTNRSQAENESETHRRLFDEITQIYKKRIPGITAPETKKRIEQLKKADNSARLKMKKMLGAKKRSRSGGEGRNGDD